MSSIPMHQIGGKAFSHSSNNDAEQEYDRLRDQARQEAQKRGQCFDKAHQAYERGDGAAAHQLSEEGKAHAAKMDAFNKQASDYIFRENNSDGRVADDTIDLHGQFVEEAENILEDRIRYAQQHGQTHLHVIVGKGNHSVNHVQKIKPRVEQVCKELGLQYATEENAGRMYINLQGGEAVMPPFEESNGNGRAPHQNKPQGQGNSQPQQSQPQQNAWQGQQNQNQTQNQNQNQNQNQQGNNDNEELEKLARKMVPRILKKLDGCCIVM